MTPVVHAPHASLVRCSIAILLLAVTIHPMASALAGIVHAMTQVQLPDRLGSMGYADVPYLLSRGLTWTAAGTWLLLHGFPVAGFVSGALLLRYAGPRWLRRFWRVTHE